MKFLSILLSLLFILTFTSCIAVRVALTESGKKVKYSTKAEASSDCQLLDEVDVSGNSMIDAKTKLRNKTGKMGGNYLVIDVISSHTSSRIDYGSSSNNNKSNTNSSFHSSNNNNNNKKDDRVVTSTYYEGSGRAYSCPQEGEEIEIKLEKKGKSTYSENEF